MIVYIYIYLDMLEVILWRANMSDMWEVILSHIVYTWLSSFFFETIPYFLGWIYHMSHMTPFWSHPFKRT